jgi:hypothetical protein
MTEASTHVSRDACGRFFFETKDGKYVARCVLIDTEKRLSLTFCKNIRGWPHGNMIDSQFRPRDMVRGIIGHMDTPKMDLTQKMM